MAWISSLHAYTHVIMYVYNVCIHINKGLIRYTSNVTMSAGFPFCPLLAPSSSGPCIILFIALSVATFPSSSGLHMPRPALCLDPVTGILQFSLGWSTQVYPIFSTFTDLQVLCSGHPPGRPSLLLLPWLSRRLFSPFQVMLV